MQPRFPGRPPPSGEDEHEGIVEPPSAYGGPSPREASLRVIGGQNQPARPDLIAAVRQWHKGLRDRSTGQIQPWTTLVLTHMESGRQIRQFDVRPDEDDIELAIEIESVMNSHGRPLATNQGITQNYQLDAYFGTRVDPQSNWIGDVKPTANTDGMGFGGQMMRQRGTPQDFEQQRFRARELEIGASFGLTRYNVEVLVGLLDKANTRIAALEAREDAIKQREQAARDAEYAQELAMMREKAKIKRMNFVVAKVARYIPIIAAKLDERLFGLSQLTPPEKEAKTTKIVETLLSKLNDNQDGAEKMNQIIAILDLKPEEVQDIKDVGVMMWLEKQRAQMQREAEVASKGGFAGLGDDVKALLSDNESPPRRQIGTGSK